MSRRHQPLQLPNPAKTMTEFGRAPYITAAEFEA